MTILRDKVAVVTGAGKSDGIGFAACKKLVLAGARVVVTDLKEFQQDLDFRVEELQALGGEAIACRLDVTSEDNVSQVIGTICEVYGGIDIVFNNAGYAGGTGEFMDIDREAWMRSWNVNVMGIVHMCREVIPVMRQRGGGAIINNSSVAGLGVQPLLSAYSASKHAVISLTKSVAIEYGHENIRVNSVCPGLVSTEMGELNVDLYKNPGDSHTRGRKRLSEQVPLGQRWSSPDEVGDAVVYLAGPQSSYITGVALPVAGGLVPGL